jgi:hypothetical protein
MFEATASMTDLLRKTGSQDPDVALAASREFTQAIELPLRKGVMSGDNTGDIFAREVLQPGATTEYPIDPLAPGTEKDFSAYAIPKHGRIPERMMDGDYVMVPTYTIANSVDWLLRYARDARWPVVNRFMEIFEAGFVKKINDDKWHLLLGAGVDRNIVVYDADANAGQFTKRLVSLMKTVMQRNGGGNSTSMNRFKLTDLYVSPEAMEDIRNWGVDIVDDFTRREIFTAPDGSFNRIFGVNLHSLEEFGEGQEYQLFFTNELAGSLASGDLELVLGLDRTHNSFVMPVREELKTFDDPTLHRQQRAGVYGWQEYGLASLEGRALVLGSF